MPHPRRFRSLALAALTLVLVGGVCRPIAAISSRSQGALPGRIAYSTSAGDLWVMNANGSCRHQVTASGAKTDYDPSWSPDGRRLVFSSERGRSHADKTRAGLDSMFVVNVEGTHEHEIEPRSGAEFPAWSPSGNKIAFTGLRGTGQATTIYTINPDGTGLHDLGIPGEAAEPVWSRDGRELAFVRHGPGDDGIWVSSATGGSLRRLTEGSTDSPGAWSPDNRELVFSSGAEAQRQLYVIAVDGGVLRRITTQPSDSADAWLPDGRIVFARFIDQQPRPHFYLVRPDGTHLESLPKLKAGDPLDWLGRRTRDRACRRAPIASRPHSPAPVSLRSLTRPLTRGAHKPPGAVAYVLDHGHASAAATGQAKAETRTPMRVATRFRIGSVSKTFTAVLVLKLVADGQLQLSDSVEHWLPGLLPNGSEISIRELLNHTSGLYDYVRDPGVRATWGTDHVPPPRRLIEIAAAHGLNFPPGTRWEYSSTNYQVLGLVVERVSGTSLANELRRRIFRPLRLRATALVPGREIPGPHANGYYLYTHGARINETRTTFGAWADGAIVSNAPELARFYAALLSGNLLPRALLSEMKKTVATGGSSDGEGAGLGIFRSSLRCGAAWGHTGGAAGFLTKVLVNAKGTRVTVMATNGLVDEGPVTQPLLDTATETAFCSRIDRH